MRNIIHLSEKLKKIFGGRDFDRTDTRMDGLMSIWPPPLCGGALITRRKKTGK